jgi:C-terminal processing protease CtpA/Prc
MRISLSVVALTAAFIIGGVSCSQAEKGTVDKTKEKGWLGVSVAPTETHKGNSEKKTGSVYVAQVVEDSPAEEAGIKEDDVLLEYNGKAISDPDDLVTAVRKSKPGETVSVVVMRDSQKKTLQVKVGKLNSIERHIAITVPPAPFASGHEHMAIERMFGSSEPLGLRLLDLNSQLGEYFGSPNGKGVLVERVKGKSPGAKAGFKAGDVILKVGKEEIEERDDIMEAMEDYEAGDTITFQILRKGANLTLAAMMPEEQQHYQFFRQKLHSVPEKGSQYFWFDRDKLQDDMRKLQDQLRTLGQEIKTKAQGLRQKIQQQLRQVGT